MKTLLTLLLCLFPLIGSGQFSYQQYVEYSGKQQKEIHSLQDEVINLTLENEKLKKSIALYASIANEQSNIIKLLEIKIELYKQEIKPDRIIESGHGKYITIDTTKLRTRMYYRATDGNMYQIPIK